MQKAFTFEYLFQGLCKEVNFLSHVLKGERNLN